MRKYTLTLHVGPILSYTHVPQGVKAYNAVNGRSNTNTLLPLCSTHTHTNTHIHTYRYKDTDGKEPRLRD